MKAVRFQLLEFTSKNKNKNKSKEFAEYLDITKLNNFYVIIYLSIIHLQVYFFKNLKWNKK